MFRPLHKIDKVLRYTIFDGMLIASFGNEDRTGIVRKIDLSSCETVIEKHVHAYLLSFFIRKGALFSVNADHDGLLLDDSLNVLETIPSPLKIGDIHLLSDFVVVLQGGIKKREFGIYSLPDRKVLWLDDQQKALEVFQDKLFGQNSYELHRSDMMTGQIIWRRDLGSMLPTPEKSKGRAEFIGIHEDLLIVGVQKLDKVFALDVDTGTIKWEINTFVRGLRIENGKGRLHQMLVNYAAYDVRSGELIDNFKDDLYFQSAGIESQRSNYVLDGNYIITTDWRKGVVGAFNIVTHGFDWIHQEDGLSFPAANPIIYQGSYLLVHDNHGALHIFIKGK